MIDVDALAKVLCIVDGHDPTATHNGYDKMWRLYWTQACKIAGLYNELYPERKGSDSER